MGTKWLEFIDSVDCEGFHSINVPSEWGLAVNCNIDLSQVKQDVSIQLMSPASGDLTSSIQVGINTNLMGKFPFN